MFTCRTPTSHALLGHVKRHFCLLPCLLTVLGAWTAAAAAHRVDQSVNPARALATNRARASNNSIPTQFNSAFGCVRLLSAKFGSAGWLPRPVHVLATRRPAVCDFTDNHQHWRCLHRGIRRWQISPPVHVCRAIWKDGYNRTLPNTAVVWRPAGTANWRTSFKYNVMLYSSPLAHGVKNVSIHKTGSSNYKNISQRR